MGKRENSKIHIYIYREICRVGLFGRRHLLLLRVSCSLRSNHQATAKNNGYIWRCTKFENSEQCIVAWYIAIWLVAKRNVLQEEFLRMSTYTIRYQFASADEIFNSSYYYIIYIYFFFFCLVKSESNVIDINFVVVIFIKLKRCKEVHYKALFKID